MEITKRLSEILIPGQILPVQVGITWTAVLAEVEGEIRCGLAGTMSNPEFEHHHQPSVRSAGRLHEMRYMELAALLVDFPSQTGTSIGLAAINTLLLRTLDTWVDLNAEDYLIKVELPTLEGMIQFWVRKRLLLDENAAAMSVGASCPSGSCESSCTGAADCTFVAKKSKRYAFKSKVPPMNENLLPFKSSSGKSETLCRLKYGLPEATISGSEFAR
jgi:hypothetical protein